MLRFYGSVCSLDDARIVVVPVTFPLSVSSPKHLRGSKAASWIQFTQDGSTNSIGTFDVVRERETIEMGICCDELIYKKQLAHRFEELAAQDKKLCTLSNDCRVIVESIKFHNKKYDDLCLLHIDSRPRLKIDQGRDSVVRNLLEETDIKQIAQVGVCDVTKDEFAMISSEERITTFFDTHKLHINNLPFIAHEVIKEFTEGKGYLSGTAKPNVYITLNTSSIDSSLYKGNVPGGLSWYKLCQVLHDVSSNSNVVGFDLIVEGECDGVVVAKTLYELLGTLNI